MDQYQQASQASQMLKDERSSARTEALNAIRLIEVCLVEALAGERLRALPNLTRGSARAKSYFAARVRGKHGEGLYDDRFVLVLDDCGMLMMANVSGSRVAEDSDLLAEDLEKLTVLVKDALEGHVQACTKSAKSYAKCADLARRVGAALTDFTER